MISVVCFLWGGNRDFQPEYVNTLAAIVAAHLSEPHRFICVIDGNYSGFSDRVEVVQLPAEASALGSLQNPGGEKFPSSYRRLWALSKDAASILGEKIMMLDIDCMIVRSMAPLLAVEGDFVGWKARTIPGTPARFGGGTWMHRTGTRSYVYEQFIENPIRAIKAARAAGYRGSDQAWISYCLAPTERSWDEPSGIYCAQDYRKAWRMGPAHRSRRARPIPEGLRGRLVLPPDAIILHMNGIEKPWNSTDEIIEKYWRPYHDQERAKHAERRHVPVE